MSVKGIKRKAIMCSVNDMESSVGLLIIESIIFRISYSSMTDVLLTSITQLNTTVARETFKDFVVFPDLLKKHIFCTVCIQFNQNVLQ